MSDEEDWAEELGIKPGAIVESSKSKFVVDKLLGEGGFGAVFKVYDQSNPKCMFAMKVEKKVETRKHSKLKMEVGKVDGDRPTDLIALIAILKLVCGERTNSHFTAIVDRGKKENYFFLVMQLVGKSLQDLKKIRENNVFSIGTGCGASIQCLEAVEDLHKHGFIHRDLKPANYACGLGPHVRVVYILDFGIARKITNDKNELKTPRSSVRFKGTIRFASIACHKNKEMGMKDDVESWFYLLLDLICPAGLPWKKLSEKNDVLKAKEDSREKKELLYNGLKAKDEFHEILRYIDSLTYTDHVDYKFIYEKLKKTCQSAGGSVDDPYDWEEADKSNLSKLK